MVDTLRPAPPDQGVTVPVSLVSRRRLDEVFLRDLATEGDPDVAERVRRELAANPGITVFQAVRPSHLISTEGTTHILPEPIPPLNSIRQEPDLRQ